MFRFIAKIVDFAYRCPEAFNLEKDEDDTSITNKRHDPANDKYIVGCQGVLQLAGLALGYPWEVPLRLKLLSLFYSLKVPLDLKIKNTCLSLL